MEKFQDSRLRGLEFDTCDVDQTYMFMGLVLQVVLYGALLSESVVLFQNSSKMERLNQVDSLFDSTKLLHVIHVRRMFTWFKHVCFAGWFKLGRHKHWISIKSLKSTTASLLLV